MKKSVKKFEKQRLVSFLLAVLLIVGIFPNFAKAEEGPEVVDLDPADVEIFPAKDYYCADVPLANDPRLGFTDDEIGIVVKERSATKYSGKKIIIPDTINGKTVVALGYPRGYNTFIKNNNYFPVLSKATHIKYIADRCFRYIIFNEIIELKNLPNLVLIGKEAFYYTASDVILENLPKLEEISEEAFSGAAVKNISMSNLPKLKKIGRKAFYKDTEYGSNDKTVDVKDLPNLEDVGTYTFWYQDNNFATGNIDLRASKKLNYVSSTVVCYGISILISEPGPNFTGKYYGGGNLVTTVALHRITFEFAPKDGIGVIPDSLREIQPDSYCVYPALSKYGVKLIFDPVKNLEFTKFIDPATGNEWEFKGWKTEDEYHISKDRYEIDGWDRDKTIFDVKYTGTWELLFNKEDLKKAIEEANAKKKDVVVSEDGEGLPFTTKWVTDAAQNEFTTAINTAQDIFDNQTTPGDTAEARQQYIDKATNALKDAIAKYSPQEGKQTYDENPTYDQPEGAHKVTFAKGNGIESLTDESTFYYVKDNTVLPKEKFPQATAKAGFGTKIFWNPAQDTPITSDQAFTASAKAVDKSALEAKITEADELLQKDSTSDHAVALKTVVDEAKALVQAVDAGTERNQDTVDAKVTELEAAIQALKDLNTKKEEAKTEIGAIDGLSNEEKDKLKEEVDNAKNEEAINEIKDKAAEQAKDNNALKEATALVEKAEQEKTQEAYVAAKAKVDALKEGTDKTALEGRLAEVDKYIKADDALKALEGKEIKDVTAEELTNAENLVNQVKDDWKAPLTQRLEALKTAKTEYDTEKAAEEAAEKAVKDLEDKNGNVTDEEIAAAQDKVDKVTDQDKKDELQERLDQVKEDKKKADDEKKAEDEAEKAVKDLEDKNGNVTDEEIAGAQDKVDKVTDPDKKKDLQDRLDQVKEDKKKVDDEKKKEDEAEKAVKDLEDKKGNVTDEEIADAQDKVDKVTDQDKKDELQERLDKVKEDKKKVDDEKKAEEAAEKAVKDLEDKNGNVTDEEINDAQDKVDKVTDQDKKDELQERLDKVKEDKKKVDDEKAEADALARAKEEAKNTINALQNLTDDEKAPFIKRVDDATTIPEVNEAVLDAQKADAKKKVDAMDNLTDDEKDKAKEDIDNAQTKDEVDQAVEDAQNKNDQHQSLDAYKDDAKKKIDALDKLTPEEKEGYKGRIDQAQTKEDVDAIVLEAQKENAKRTVDAMDNLTDDEKDKAKEDIDNAQTKDEVDQAVEDAQNKNDQHQSLDAYKDDAKKKIDALDKLTPEEKEGYKGRIDQAQTKAEVDAIVLEAIKENAKRKVTDLNNLTEDEKNKADNAIDNANTEREVNDAVAEAERRNDDHRRDNEDYRYNRPLPFGPFYFGYSSQKPEEPKTQSKPELIVRKAYIKGYPDGTFKPEGQITRAEAASMIANLAGLDVSDASNPGFKDTPNAWYNAVINAMIKKNLMEADENGNFRPNEAITRAEFARAIYNLDKANSSKTMLKDIEGHKYQQAIERAYANGHISGYPDGTFRPDKSITRAEAVKILNHFDGRKVNVNSFDNVTADLKKFTDLSDSHWAYYEILAACNTYSSSVTLNGLEVVSKIY